MLPDPPSPIEVAVIGAVIAVGAAVWIWIGVALFVKVVT